jgi:chromosome segregation ATPase
MAEEAELREEVSRLQAEVERLRRLLIARDAELGAARGRLTQLEEPYHSVVNAARRVSAPSGLRLLDVAHRLTRRGRA